MRRLLTTCLVTLALAGCEIQTVPVPAPSGGTAPTEVARRTGSGVGLGDFRVVVDRVEPVAEAACRERTGSTNCDFAIFVEESDVANAFQTYNRRGQPVIVFTTGLFGEMRNRDELAFALAHEAAHHIRGHIEQTNRSAQTGALLGVLAGSLAGLDQQGVSQIADIGGTIGARRYSKGFELEADQLGALITERAGYDAVRGVQYFARAADPGDRFLGTHPPNADRIAVVRQTLGR